MEVYKSIAEFYAYGPLYNLGGMAIGSLGTKAFELGQLAIRASTIATRASGLAGKYRVLATSVRDAVKIGHTAEEVFQAEQKAVELEQKATQLEAAMDEATNLAERTGKLAQESQKDADAYNAAVANGTLDAIRGLRQQYVQEVQALAGEADRLRAEGKAAEEIARTLSAERRAIGIKYKDMTPPGTLERIYARNRQLYGDDPLGPTIDWYRASGKTWEEIIASASKPGGKDTGYF